MHLLVAAGVLSGALERARVALLDETGHERMAVERGPHARLLSVQEVAERPRVSAEGVLDGESGAAHGEGAKPVKP